MVVIAKGLSEAATDDFDDDFEDDSDDSGNYNDRSAAMGGRDSSIRRRIEERMERRRLIEDLGLAEDEFDF